MDTLLEDPNIFMILEQKCIGQSPQESAENCLILIVEALDILGQLRLFFARFPKIIEYEFIKSIYCGQCCGFNVEGLVTESWQQNSINQLQYKLDIKSQEYKLKVLAEEVLKQAVHSFIELFISLHLVKILVEKALHNHLSQLRECVVIVVFAYCEVDVVPGDAFPEHPHEYF